MRSLPGRSSICAALLLLLLPAPGLAADGQEQRHFRRWVAQGQAGAVAAYESYLRAQGVMGIVPTGQLLRTASDWDKQACRDVGALPFEVPPRELWPQAVRTLKLVALLRERRILPAFEVVSAYRNPQVEQCADGAGKRHPTSGALDIVPLAPADLQPAVERLCEFWWTEGRKYDMGFSLYPSMRMHIDTTRYSTWGENRKFETSVCRR